MTGALDTRLRAAAKRLISKFGKSIEIGRESTTFDPSTGETTTTTTWTDVDSSPPEDFTLSRIEGTLIQQGDTVVQVAAKDLDLGTPDGPTQQDKLRIDGDEWALVQVGKVYSGDEIAMYVLHGRK